MIDPVRIDRATREADRLRAHRQMFEHAMARNISLAEARFEMVRAAWSAADARLAAKQCGITAPAVESDAGQGDPGERELTWWQK